jgi:hypothetical protein
MTPQEFLKDNSLAKDLKLTQQEWDIVYNCMNAYKYGQETEKEKSLPSNEVLNRFEYLGKVYYIGEKTSIVWGHKQTNLDGSITVEKVPEQLVNEVYQEYIQKTSEEPLKVCSSALDFADYLTEIYDLNNGQTIQRRRTTGCYYIGFGQPMAKKLNPEADKNIIEVIECSPLFLGKKEVPKKNLEIVYHKYSDGKITYKGNNGKTYTETKEGRTLYQTSEGLKEIPAEGYTEARNAIKVYLLSNLRIAKRNVNPFYLVGARMFVLSDGSNIIQSVLSSKIRIASDGSTTFMPITNNQYSNRIKELIKTLQ